MKYVFICLFCSFSIVYAQWQDDFSDGDFTSNPLWIGDTDSFEILTDTLHLNAPANTSESYLSTASENSIDGYWEFTVRLDFNPSSGNKAYIYLMSSESDLKNDLNGYYVLVGNTDDEVSLYRQDGNSTTEIVDGTDDLLDISSSYLKIKVERDNLGNWGLLVDTSTTFSSYENQGTVFDNTYMTSDYFGLLCDYTGTRSDKFYFDDFVVTTIPFVDDIAPVLIDYEIISLTEINLTFDERLDSLIAENTVNYSLSTIGNSSESNYQNNQISLRFADEMQGDIAYTLTLQNIEDTTGNALDTSITFVIEDAYAWQSIVFNEIYPDETPSFGLPDAEFLEIYNTTNDTLFTDNCFLSDLSDTAFFPLDTILPSEYILLCKTSAEADYSAFGKTISLVGFPSLSNDEDRLTLYNRYGQAIDSVHYVEDWYRNIVNNQGEMKEDGGYSLERVAIENPCSDFYNWYPSESNVGGTPAAINSVEGIALENEIEILSAIPIDENTLQLTFSEDFDGQNVGVFATYFITDMGIILESTAINELGENQLNIDFDENFEQGILYTVFVSDLLDCYANLIEELTLEFYLPEPLAQGDIILNEILFNPNTGGVDFVEIYNRSEKAIDIYGLTIENRDPFEEDSILESVFIDINQLIPSKAFFVFTEDKNIVLSEYDVNVPDWVFEVDLPNFDDKEDVVVLQYNDSIELDRLHFYERWHIDLLNDENGVSLERISIENNEMNNDNWTSAAESFGYGTPTAANSQYFEPNTNGEVTVSPEVFTPNGDGYKDFTLISYQFTQGYIANTTVFDVQGRSIKRLALDELIGTSGQWKWDGTNENGERQPIGVYIILIELFDLDGNKNKVKKQVVLGQKL